jgi:hypothetical protein
METARSTNLSSIGWICQALSVTDHRRGEHDFAHDGNHRAERRARKNSAVGQCDGGLDGVLLFRFIRVCVCVAYGSTEGDGSSYISSANRADAEERA